MTGAVKSGLPTPEEICREYGVTVSRLCRRMIRNRQQAEDVAQEVWIEILKALPGFEGRSKVSTWVWAITRRVVLRRAEREKRYTTRFLREFFAMNEGDGLDEMDRIPVEDRTAWVRLQCSECLTAIMHCVGNEERFVYLLRRLARMPFAEIAEATGLTDTAARQVYSRANRKIGRFLSGECTLYNPKGSCRCKMREPIRETDHAEAYRKVRDLSRRTLFLDSMDEWYGALPDYWKDIPSAT